MKAVTIIFCWILALICICFPFIYFKGNMDKKEIKISHILVETEDEAKKIEQELNEKKSFEELAEKYSICESKAQKGDLGYTIRGRFIPDFEREAFKLDKMQISHPVKTQAGWHLIKIYDIKYYSDKENFQKNIKLN